MHIDDTQPLIRRNSHHCSMAGVVRFVLSSGLAPRIGISGFWPIGGVVRIRVFLPLNHHGQTGMPLHRQRCAAVLLTPSPIRADIRPAIAVDRKPVDRRRGMAIPFDRRTQPFRFGLSAALQCNTADNHHQQKTAHKPPPLPVRVKERSSLSALAIKSWWRQVSSFFRLISRWTVISQKTMASREVNPCSPGLLP